MKKDEGLPKGVQGPAERDPNRFCSICQASFNNPLMAQQHYNGKKHKKHLTKQKLMETYGPSIVPGQNIEGGSHSLHDIKQDLHLHLSCKELHLRISSSQKNSIHFGGFKDFFFN